MSAPDVQRLAQALYETDTGTNGYPPLHESISWDDLTFRDHYIERAREIVLILAGVSS